VVQRMLRHQLLMAWNMFVDTVRETQHNRKTVRKVLLRMRHRTLAGAFDCYAGAVAKLVRQREMVAKTMAPIVRRWMQVAIIGAWNTWIDLTSRSMQIKVIARRGIQRLRLHVLLGALNIWRFAAQRQAKIFHLFKTTLVRLKNRWSFSALNSWRANALEQRRLGVLATRAVRKWTMSSLAAVMSRWLSRTIAKSLLKKTAKKGTQRWMNTERAVVFDHWRDHVWVTRWFDHLVV